MIKALFYVNVVLAALGLVVIAANYYAADGDPQTAAAITAANAVVALAIYLRRL